MNVVEMLDHHKESKLSINAIKMESQEWKEILKSIKKILSKKSFYKEVQVFQNQSFLAKLKEFIDIPHKNPDISLAVFFAYKVGSPMYRMDTILAEYHAWIHWGIHYPLLWALKNIFENSKNSRTQEMAALFQRIRLIDTPPSFVDMLSQISAKALSVIYGMKDGAPQQRILWDAISWMLK
jgi:hypothetical protein